MRIEKLSGTDTLRRLDELAGLLTDAVGHGASMGFARPLNPLDVRKYLGEVAQAVAAGDRQLFVAVDERGHVQGSAELVWDPRGRGQPCAVAQKIVVRHAWRGNGVGAALMARLEHAAVAAGQTSLAVDTGPGANGATSFCRRLGYGFAGNLEREQSASMTRPAPAAIFSKSLAPAPASTTAEPEVNWHKLAG